MPMEGRMLTPRNRTRVSPYPLRSSRTNRHQAPELPIQLPIQTEGASEWEDIRCVICMEPPHNAVLLHCSSSSNGCRPYMCDTSGRHSNCFKQYRKNKCNRLDPKTLKCPYCRGEIYEMVKVSAARRFMNAKPRSCSVEDCDFSGTYAQLTNHLKTVHPGFIPPKVDPLKQRRWEQMQRDAEYNEIMTAVGIPHSPEVEHQQVRYSHPVLRLSMQNLFAANQVRSGFGIANYAAALMPRLELRAMTMFHRGLP